MSSTEWKPTKTENPAFSCSKCKSNEILYRIPDNDGCYEDINYHCLNCNRYWWIEGSDY